MKNTLTLVIIGLVLLACGCEEFDPWLGSAEHSGTNSPEFEVSSGGVDSVQDVVPEIFPRPDSGPSGHTPFAPDPLPDFESEPGSGIYYALDIQLTNHPPTE